MQPKDQILDVYGSFAQESGGWIAIGDLIQLLAVLDVDALSVRSAASRMKRRGLLVADKREGVAGYGISSQAGEILHDGRARIFGGEAELSKSEVGQTVAGGVLAGRAGAEANQSGWIVVLFSVPETERQKRYLIRSRLERLGFGQGPASSWFAPAGVLAETERMLVRQGLSEYVTIWRGELAGFASIADLVASSWDLGEIGDRYRGYLRIYEPLEQEWTRSNGQDSEAFAVYIRQNALWRELPYLDPGLPPSVTPPHWPGREARTLFGRFENLLRPQAARFFHSIAG